MQSIKFKYKATSISTIWGILTVISTIVISTVFDLSLNMHIAMFALVASYFSSTLIFSKKITKGIKELDFENDSIKIIFFSTFKNQINITISEMQIVISDQLLKIYIKEKLTAVAYKELLLEPANWALMLSKINSK